MGRTKRTSPGTPRSTRLAEWRGYRDLTFEELAARVGMSVSLVHAREHDITEMKASELPRFAKALACRPSDLLPDDVPLAQLEIEHRLIDTYRALKPEDQLTVGNVARDLASRGRDAAE